MITDTVIQKKYTHLQLAQMAIKGGADVIQFRAKNMPTGEMIDTATRMKKLCSKHGVLFTVNDRTDVALISNADGVHLGKEDIAISNARKLLGKNKIIGGTAHSLKEAMQREKQGADYIGFGHIYTTYSKHKKDKPKGIDYLKRVVKRIKIPIFAIGGINRSNIDDVMSTGVHGVAVIGAIINSKDPAAETHMLRKTIYG